MVLNRAYPVAQVRVREQDSSPVDVIGHTYDRSANKQFYLIHLEEESDPGDVLTVYIPFSGKMVTGFKGIFYSVYDEDGDEE
jgi:hypothetical protein